MKYEMIFGDERLFDGAGLFSGVDIVTRNVDDGLYRTSRLSDCTPSTIRRNPIVAMRRIIKEPVAPVWTKKDRESETLPELGSLIVGESSGVVYEVIKVTKAGVVIFADTPDDVVGYYDKRDILLFFKPIETPAEKAQREENEFVTSLCKELDGTSLQHDSIYERGARAAYRKLKGGE